jgi:inner membrane protein
MAFSLRASIGLRLVLIGILTLILLIPTAMISTLITEREERRNAAVLEVSSKWGSQQIIAGAVLIIPYKVILRQFGAQGNSTTIASENLKYIYLLPQTLHITAELTPEIRRRGIYDVALYHAKVHLSGRFSLSELKNLDIEQPENIEWHNTTFAIGISDLKGIRDTIPIEWNSKTLLANPGLPSRDVIGKVTANPYTSQPRPSMLYDTDFATSAAQPALSGGVSAKLTDLSFRHADSVFYTFSATLSLNGSEAFMIVPVGKDTRLTVSSNWAHPSAIGAYLPEQPIDATSSGFSATWRVLHLNRDYPQAWIDNAYSIYNSAFGVRLLLPIDEYQKNMRSIKYAIMFIGLTFIALIMTELLTRKAIHPIQYLLIGLALVIFYVLLLSLSEHIGFNWAYTLSSLAVIGLIAGYTKSVLQNITGASLIAAILMVLYGFLFTILQLQDYALLLGSFLLFFTLVLVMYLTRKIDWFDAGKALESAEKEKANATQP